jgi:putative ABC transport system permease protein
MVAPKYFPFIAKQIIRHPARSALTIGGVATAMFLFVAVQAMQRGVHTATHQSAADNTLVVYREDRFCPFTSRLPEYYLPQIERIEGVRSVVPMKIVVNNCRASLDVVTFRGVPREQFIAHYAASFDFVDGSISEWKKRSDAALLGQTLAARRGLKVGDRFDAAGVVSYVAGIVRSDEPQDQNVAFVHLDFLQQTVDRKLGTVTQFNVKVADPAQLDAVAAAIDAVFKNAEFPTSTRSEKAFVAQVAADMIELIDFTKYMGIGCLAAVLALVANAIVLSVQDRIKEHAILQTLGYRGGLIGRLIVSEGLLLALAGGAAGTVLALGAIRWTRFSLSVDGLSIPIEADAALLGLGLLIAAALGVLAGLAPAWQASRRPIAHCFRAV